jgi:hypothetical protein
VTGGSRRGEISREHPAENNILATFRM